MRQLGELDELLTAAQRSRVQLVAVAPDSAEDLGRMATQLGDAEEHVLLLSDPDSRVIGRYGLRNAESSRGLPHPTTLVIDAKRVVRWRFTETDYRIRPSNADIRKALIAAGLPPG